MPGSRAAGLQDFYADRILRGKDGKMVHFVGAGPGAEDLITVRGARLIAEADRVIYAGSLVNPALLQGMKPGADALDSAKMTLEEVIAAIRETEEKGGDTVRLASGDPCLYGTVREQMDQLDRLGIPYDNCPGVSSFCAAAASLKTEYTLPGVSQSVIITRTGGRTPVPEKESLRSFAAHGATMVLFLSTGLAGKASRELIAGGMPENTPAAVVYRASWPDERVFRCTLGTLAETCRREKLTNTALLVIGGTAAPESYERSKLYDPDFTTGCRKGRLP